MRDLVGCAISKDSPYFLGMSIQPLLVYGPCYIFLDEDRFIDLSDSEKRALIVRETTHLQERHTAKVLFSRLSFSFIGALILSKIFAPKEGVDYQHDGKGRTWIAPRAPAARLRAECKKSGKIEFSAELPTSFWGFFPLLFSYSTGVNKYFEFKADEAAVQFDCADGMIKLFEKCEKEQQALEADRQQWTLLVWKRKVMNALFGSHPAPQDRAVHLRKKARCFGVPLHKSTAYNLPLLQAAKDSDYAITVVDCD